MSKNNKSKDISFLGKSVLVFRSIRDRLLRLRLLEKIISGQKKLAGYDSENSPPEAKISFAFGISKVVIVTVLCLFLSIVLIFGGNIISYENVYYMFKDIGYISSFSEERPESLSYSKPISNQDFSTFKNGLAVAGDSEIKFFTSTGRTTLTLGSSYTNPKISCADNFALIYDQGRRDLSIYNSFINVYSETSEYPISYAHMASDGSFCVVSKSKSYGSIVRIYDSDFNLETEYSKNDYVLSACISDNGKYVAVLSLDASDGDSFVSLNILKRGESELYSTTHLYGFMPYTAAFVDDNRIAVVCDELVAVYDLKGNMKNDYGYPGVLTDISFTDNGFALVFDEKTVGADNIVTIFDGNGDLQGRHKIQGQVTDIKISDGYVYVLLENEFRRINRGVGLSRSVPLFEDAAEIVTFDNGEVMVCTPGAAYYVSFD